MIQIKDNLIPKDILKACSIFLNKSAFTYGWQSNIHIDYGHWNFDITNTTKSNPTDVSSKLTKETKLIWSTLNKEFFKGQGKLTRCYANRHTFGTEGYIHTDTEREQDHTVVIYLDEDWNPNYGGETVFYSKDYTSIIQSVIPTFGRVVVFPGNIPHKASALTRICNKVRTTLMFKVTIDPKAMYTSETLLTSFLSDIGADKKPHEHGSLRDHLLRVYHILKSFGANDILALAGGLHSVYSTSTYKLACLPITSEKVEETFGPEVDRLVKLFCTIDRPQKLETPDGTLSEIDLFLLRCIECANLYDQNELTPEKYPNLFEFSKGIRQN